MKFWTPILVAAAMLANVTGLRAADVGLIDINGVIGPATAGFIARAIDVSEKRNDACLIIRINTPGGVLKSTEEIVGKMFASKVPIVTYVSPAPGMAGSAGVFITMAGNVAAMAPNTSIGAAHPVEIGMSGNVEKMDEVMKTKLEKMTSSFAENIADRRHRNIEWARSAVIESEAITAEKALELNVIDLIAADLPDLLKQIDGRNVGDAVLHTAGAKIIEIPQTFREKFLQWVLRPEAMFVLMLIIIYGVIGELSNPGAILPGVAGAIALILFLYMSTALPVNVAGIAFMILAVLLFVADIYAPTHGVLTAGGIISFFLGGLMLFDRSNPAFRLSLAWLVPGTVMTALFFLFIVGAGLRAQRWPVKSGRETMLGKTVAAMGRIDASTGKVFVEGEYWNAVSDTPVEAGQPVEIVGIAGLTLKVKPCSLKR